MNLILPKTFLLFFNNNNLETRDVVADPCHAIGGCKSAQYRSSFVLSIRNGLGFSHRALNKLGFTLSPLSEALDALEHATVILLVKEAHVLHSYPLE